MREEEEEEEARTGCPPLATLFLHEEKVVGEGKVVRGAGSAAGTF